MAKNEELASKYWQEVSLTVVSRENKGKKFTLKDGENIIGRIGDIVIDQEGVSRNHARIIVGEAISVEDLGSALGTMLNSRLLVGKDYIFDGDELSVGQTVMRFTAKVRENRVSVIGALLALLVGAALFMAGIMLQDHFESKRKMQAERARLSQTDEKKAKAPEWREWGLLVLPTRAELEAENIPINRQSALTEFNQGNALFNDRMLAPGNAYFSTIHMKRALAILGELPLEERPAVQKRALERCTAAQNMIKEMCDSRVFTYVRSRQMRYWHGCRTALSEITEYSPLPQDGYHEWAQGTLTKLNRMLAE